MGHGYRVQCNMGLIHLPGAVPVVQQGRPWDVYKTSNFSQERMRSITYLVSSSIYSMLILLPKLLKETTATSSPTYLFKPISGSVFGTLDRPNGLLRKVLTSCKYGIVWIPRQQIVD